MVTLRTIYRRFTSNVSPPHKRKTSPWDRLLHFRAWRMLEILFQEIDNLESASDQVKIDFSKWKVESFVRKKKKRKDFSILRGQSTAISFKILWIKLEI